MKAIVIQHSQHEDSGHAAPWLSSQGVDVDHVRLYESDHRFPGHNDYDLLIICGGPMGVYDEHEYPWLTAEKTFIRGALAARKKILGLCLGGQLIAAASGASVGKNAQPEIGWFSLNAHSNDNAFQFPPEFVAMQWHYDTFQLPEGATLLASSASCKNQAYQIGQHAIGLQFHPEMREQEIRFLIDNFPEELKPLTGIQDYHTIARGIDQHAANGNALLEDMLRYLLNI